MNLDCSYRKCIAIKALFESIAVWISKLTVFVVYALHECHFVAVESLAAIISMVVIEVFNSVQDKALFV